MTYNTDCYYNVQNIVFRVLLSSSTLRRSDQVFDLGSHRSVYSNETERQAIRVIAENIQVKPTLKAGGGGG